MPKMGVLGKTEVSKFERKYQKFQNMKEMKSKQYMTPSIKVVKFQVEQGFAGSGNETEKMNRDSNGGTTDDGDGGWVNGDRW